MVLNPLFCTSASYVRSPVFRAARIQGIYPVQRVFWDSGSDFGMKRFATRRGSSLTRGIWIRDSGARLPCTTGSTRIWYCASLQGAG